MAMTYDQFWERLQGKLRKFVLRILREEGVYNELMWLDGKIDVVSADGKTADVFINGATTSTKAIPIANGLKVVVGDEVIVLNRAKMRDLVVMYGKSTSSISNQSWIAPTLLNGWLNYGSPFALIGYYKDSLGIVHLRGLLKSGTANSTMFTLPSGYRPSFMLLFADIAGATSDALGRIDIDATGNVIQKSGSQTYVSLDGITFRAEQ